MLAFILLLVIIFGTISFGIKATDSFLRGIVWVCIKLPLALMFGMLGITCCATILLIPIGIIFLKFAGLLLSPCA